MLRSFFIVCTILFSLGHTDAQNTTRIILDADTGNEVDDLFAVTRALLEPSWEISALNAAQWQGSQWSIPETMENSHRLNQLLIGEIGSEVRTKRGGVDRMFDWGDKAQHSAAAYHMINEAESAREGERIKIVVLGALTNVGSAIFIEPNIAEKLEVYWLGSTYDFDKQVMKKLDFNCVMDVQALDVVLHSKAIMHIFPVNVAAEMQFSREEVEKRLKGKHMLGDFLADRWTNHLDGSRKHRVIWDLALVQAVIDPSLAVEKSVLTSKENGNREVFFYQNLEVEKMKEDFYKVMTAFMTKESDRKH